MVLSPYAIISDYGIYPCVCPLIIKKCAILHTLLALITPALSQRRPILRRPLIRQEQISTYRHLGPLLTPR